jgi:hypothetical protein
MPALSRPEWRSLLADVNLYRVGHHGSRNATPRQLWDLFKHAGSARMQDEEAGDSFCSELEIAL